jgi:hypothetical protein
MKKKTLNIKLVLISIVGIITTIIFFIHIKSVNATSPEFTSTTTPYINYTFAPYISSNCNAFAAPEPKYFETPKGDCKLLDPNGKKMFWLLASTNENDSFGGGTMSDVKPDDKIFKYQFYKKTDGNYSVGFVLDKINFPNNFTDKYTFVGFLDSYDINSGIPRPTLNKNLFMDVDLNVFAFENPKTTVKNRIMLGIVARDSSKKTYYLEINLLKTANFDLCTSKANTGGTNIPFPCDFADYYDRRSKFGNSGSSSGELVYFNINNLSKLIKTPVSYKFPSIKNDSNLNSISIPVTYLFNIAPWIQKPNLKDLKIAGTYIGIEIQGKGRSWIKFQNYRLYSK